MAVFFVACRSAKCRCHLQNFRTPPVTARIVPKRSIVVLFLLAHLIIVLVSMADTFFFNNNESTSNLEPGRKSFISARYLTIVSAFGAIHSCADRRQRHSTCAVNRRPISSMDLFTALYGENDDDRYYDDDDSGGNVDGDDESRADSDETSDFDDMTIEKIRFRCRVAYDGTSFCGFQLQQRPAVQRVTGNDDDTKNLTELSRPLRQRSKQQRDRTVQGVLEDSLSERFQRPIMILGAGRTDAGVHATGQAIHFDLWKNETSVSKKKTDDGRQHDDMFLQKFEVSLNSMLPTDVRIWNLERAPTPTSSSLLDVRRPWHVMQNTVGKLYTYRLGLGDYMDPMMRHYRWQCEWGHDVDIERLRRILKLYEGRHNFICFSGALERNERKTGIIKTTTRTVTTCRLICEDDVRHLYRIEIQLEGALYKMVRNMVSTAIDVSRGWLDEQTFLDMLYRPDELNLTRASNKCKPAPPVGLTLENVDYGERTNE
mmetsp:Transcript_2025/g.4665  ORF Transcript_2025/g.4665 Transcript_2025/m.4665 type:complete len:486 (-) Transcript_2025:675-2132(-)